MHEGYLCWLYEQFKDYCPAGPKIENIQLDKTTGKVSSSIFFTSYSLPCFVPFHDDFYLAGKKIVPQNIGELLTPLGLGSVDSYDGSFDQRDGVVVLHTQGFTKEEVELLVKTLNDKWDLNCTINKSGSGFKIRIPKKSVPVLQNYCGQHMPPMMRFKIGL